MKKLHQGIADYAFGEHGHFHLPRLLNFHGVSLKTFENMHLADQPHLLRQVLVYQLPKLKYPLRNYLNRFPKASGGDIFRGVTQGRTMTEMGELQQQLRKWAKDLVCNFRLYQSADGIKSEIAGSFSWSTSDQYEAELEMWKDAECQNCTHTETFRDDGMGDEMADLLKEFEHVSGEYVRCNLCDSVTRLTISDADSIPNNQVHYDGDEWDQYQEHLQYLLDELGKDIKAKGLPQPDGMQISASNVDWRGRDGRKQVKFDGEELARGMSVDSDFTISNGRLRLPEVGVGYLSCRMSHHDVPTGGNVTATPYWWCELGSEIPVVGDGITELAHLCKAAEHLFCGSGPQFEYSEGSSFVAVSEAGFSDSLDWLIKQLDLEEGDPILYFLNRLNTDDACLADDAEAIRALIDQRLSYEEAA